MMGVMDLGLLERESGSARLWTGPAAQPADSIAPPPHHELPSGAGYDPGRSRGGVLAAILLLHVAAIGALATARSQAARDEGPPRVATFAIEEPSPLPPLEPLPPQAAVQPVSSPIAAPVAALKIPRQVQVEAVQPKAVRPTIAPPALVVNNVAPPAPAQPAPAAPAPIVPPNFAAAQLRNAGPSYPFLSRRAKEEGVVLLKVLVGTDGKAARLEIEESSGFERLDEAALKTVGKWRFVPASQGGQPREAWVLVPVTFSLG